MPSPKKSKKTTPVYMLQYWNVRGRAEAIRLTLSLCGLDWTEDHLDDTKIAEMKKKAGTAESPFGQWPLLKEDDVVLAQSSAILKHLGRQHGLYGRNKMEDYLIDSFLLGAEAIGSKLSDLIFMHKNSPEAREKFEKEHILSEAKTGRCGGAHLAYLEGFLERSSTEWVAGGKKPSIADIVLFDLFQSILQYFDAEKPKALYPKLTAHQEAVANIEEIAAYLKSEKRPK